jgi:hypothetical protein
MLLDRKTRWYGLAAIVAPLLLLSFSSHTFWQYLHDAGQILGLADGIYIHPLIAAIGLIATVTVLAGLYQRLPNHSHPTSTWLLGIAIVGLFLGLIGLLGFFSPAGAWWVFVGLGGGFLLPFIALIGLGYYVFVNKALGLLSFTPTAVVMTTLAIALTADLPAGIDRPINQVFVVLYILCWFFLGLGLMRGTEADAGQPVPA